MIDIRQSGEYSRYLSRNGWIVEKIGGNSYFIKKLPLIGSVIKLQRPEKIRTEDIDFLCRKYGVFQIIIEPKNQVDADTLASYGYRLIKTPYLPTKTIQINLKQSEEEIFKALKKDARRAVRKGSGIKIVDYSSPNKIKKFREAWKKSVNYKRYVPSVKELLNLRKSFPQSKSLFVASHNIFSRIIGGVIFTTSSHKESNYITYYWQAFTNSEGRTSLSQYSLLYHGILWAKRHGYNFFDFEGIYDPRFPNKDWLGFTHFKRSFGGKEIQYPGCYTKFRLPF